MSKIELSETYLGQHIIVGIKANSLLLMELRTVLDYVRDKVSNRGTKKPVIKLDTGYVDSKIIEVLHTARGLLGEKETLELICENTYINDMLEVCGIPLIVKCYGSEQEFRQKYNYT